MRSVDKAAPWRESVTPFFNPQSAIRSHKSTMNTVTPQDHDAGFKDVEVVLRNGTHKTIRLNAPSYRVAQRLAMELQQKHDVLCITAACPGGEHARQDPEKFLNTLTLESASVVETVAFALTFGSEFQKKMEALGEKISQTMDSTASARKWPLLLADLPQGTCVDIRCPSCSCTIALSAKNPSAETSAESIPAPPAA